MALLKRKPVESSNSVPLNNTLLTYKLPVLDGLLRFVFFFFLEMKPFRIAMAIAGLLDGRLRGALIWLNPRQAAARRRTLRDGGCLNTPRLTRLMDHVAKRGKRHSKERQKS